jgi:hypothetical protein
MMETMMEFGAKPPTIPIPFHKLLKVVALVDGADPHIGALLDRIKAEGYEIEISDRYDRDVSEDASVGAYIASVDGERREPARKMGQAVRRIGFKTPLWALADSHKISDVAVLGATGEVDGYIYLGQQTPTFYAKQVIASIVEYGMSLLPPFFGGMMAYDAEANVSFACPAIRAGSSTASRPRASSSSSTSARASSATICATPTSISATCSFTRARPSAHSDTPRRSSAPTRPTSC